MHFLRDLAGGSFLAHDSFAQDGQNWPPHPDIPKTNLDRWTGHKVRELFHLSPFLFQHVERTCDYGMSFQHKCWG